MIRAIQDPQMLVLLQRIRPVEPGLFVQPSVGIAAETMDEHDVQMGGNTVRRCGHEVPPDQAVNQNAENASSAVRLASSPKNRKPMRTFRPSIHPSSSNPCRNAAVCRRTWGSSSVLETSTPTRRIR